MNRFIRHNPTGEADGQLCQLVWPAMSAEVYDTSHYVTLAEYVRYEMIRGKRALEVVEHPTEDMEKVAKVLTSVRTSAHKSMRDVVAELELKDSGQGDKSQKSLEVMRLAVSLIAMTQVRTIETPNPGQMSIAWWRTDMSLKETLEAHFRTTPTPEPKAREIAPELTISYLVVNYKFHVNWTNCLDQHLDIDWKRRIISIFQHKIWLSAHVDSEDQCVVPPPVICEALDTLNLLFPHNDAPTKSFLDRQGQSFYSLALCGRRRKSNLRDYPYWGKKIDDLLGILDSPPIGFRQLLLQKDRPNLVESVNFWIATFVAGLAIISFVFGLIAVVYAKESLEVSKESLELTRLQYLLSVAQACSAPESARLLPDFCPQSR